MSNISKGLCWALAFLLLAAGNRFGLIADSTMRILFVVFPVTAVLSVRAGVRACHWRGRESA